MKFFSFQTRKPKRADRRSPFETDHETDDDMSGSGAAFDTDIDDQRARRRDAWGEQPSSLSGADRRSSADRAAQRAADEPEYEPDPKPESDEATEADPFDAIADLSGGADRHEAVIGFGEKNFRSEPAKSELSAAAARVRDADRSLKAHLAAAQPAPKPAQSSPRLAQRPTSGPAPQGAALSLTGRTGPRRAPSLSSDATVFRPAAHLLDDLAFLGKEAEQTLGPAVPKPTRRSPRASAHLPYATREDHAADVIQANAVARRGGDDAPIRAAIDQRLFRTAEWRRGEGALPLGRLTEPQPKQASSFLDDKAVEVAKVDTGVRNDGAEYEGWTGTLPNVGDTADPSWDEYQALVSRSQPKRSFWQKAAKVYDDLPGLWTLPGFAENKEKAEWLAPAASAAAAAAPAFGLSLQAGSTGGRILGGALAAYLEGAYEAMLRGAKPEDVVRQGLQSAPYGAVGTVATQLDDLPVPGRNTVFGGVPGPTGRSAEAERRAAEIQRRTANQTSEQRAAVYMAANPAESQWFGMGRDFRKHYDEFYSDEIVSSTSVPPFHSPNTRLAGTRHPVTDVPFDDRGYPIFDSKSVVDIRFVDADFLKASPRTQMRLASRRLWDDIQAGHVSLPKLSKAEVEQLRSGRRALKDWVWHHHQESGRMQLVERNTHAETAHIGGVAMGEGR